MQFHYKNVCPFSCYSLSNDWHVESKRNIFFLQMFFQNARKMQLIFMKNFIECNFAIIQFTHSCKDELNEVTKSLDQNHCRVEGESFFSWVKICVLLKQIIHSRRTSGQQRKWAQLTTWSRVFIEKLIVAQPLNKFPAFYENQILITTFTRAHDWSLSWATWIQFTNSHSSEHPF
jgi:hypothetical protein